MFVPEAVGKGRIIIKKDYGPELVVGFESHHELPLSLWPLPSNVAPVLESEFCFPRVKEWRLNRTKDTKKQRSPE